MARYCSDVLRHVAHPLLSLPFKSSCLPSPVADLTSPPLLHSFRAKFCHERDERTVALSHLRVEQGRVLGPFCSVDVVTVAPCFKGFLYLAVVVRRSVEGWAAGVRALWAGPVRTVLFGVRGVRGARGAVLFSTALGGCRCWWAGWHPSVLPVFARGLRTRLDTRGFWGPGWCRDEGKTVPWEAARSGGAYASVGRPCRASTAAAASSPAWGQLDVGVDGGSTGAPEAF